MIASISGIGISLAFVGLNLFTYAEKSILQKMEMMVSIFGASGRSINYYCMGCGTKQINHNVLCADLK
jgi:hypothetical protein